MSTISWRVGELAASRGLTARRLAQAAGLDEKTVRNIINGRASRVDLETIARLSNALNVRPGALWEFEPGSREAWEETAGAAGQASPAEIEEVLADDGSE